jgi:hypothetical protein
VAITWTSVVNLPAPELATVPADAQTTILAAVALQMNADVWGEKLDLGSAYLAAHLATVGKRAGVGGPVTHQSVGQVSQSFAASVAQGAAHLGSTSYGLEYERLLYSLAAARMPVVV